MPRKIRQTQFPPAVWLDERVVVVGIVLVVVDVDVDVVTLVRGGLLLQLPPCQLVMHLLLLVFVHINFVFDC